MILDRLERAERYKGFHRRLATALKVLRQDGLADRDDGRHAIEGEELFVILERTNGRGREHSPLEFHRRYLDVQFVVSGQEQIGWKPLADCRCVREPYDSQRDLGTFGDPPTLWLPMTEGMFAIFFPEDAHAPLAGSGPVRKAVVKVALD